MAAPWEKYQQAPAASTQAQGDGPWAKYAAPTAKSSDGTTIPVDVVTPGQDPDSLAAAFYAATKRGDGPAATKAFRAIRAQGATLRPASPEEQAIPNAAGANGLGTNLQNFAAGIGKSVVDNARGLPQAGLEALNTFLSPVKAVDDAAGQANPLAAQVSDALAQSKADEADVRRRDAALIGTKSGLAGDITGYGLQMALPAAGYRAAQSVRGLAAAPDVLAALNGSGVRAATAQGAAQGLIQPLATGEGNGTRLVNAGEGALAGGGGTAIPAVVGAGVRGVKGLAAPFFESGQNGIVADAIRRFGGDSAINAKPSAIPGVQATLAEQTGDGGLAQLQRAVADSDPGIARQFSDARNANNAARLAALQGISGDANTLAAAKGARAAAANQLYAKAVTDAPIQPSADLIKLAQRPSMQRAIDMAKGLAAENDQNIGDALSSTQGLHYVKLALDNLANVAGKPGFENVSKGSVRATQNDLINEIGKISPEYLAAKDAYKAASGPINQQQILQGLLGKATTNTEDALGNQVAQPARFANAAAGLDTLAQKVTGQKGITADSILTPAQRDTIGLVGSDLSRQAVADSVGKSAGSNTVQNLASQSLLGSMTRGAGLPGLADSGFLGRVVKPVDTAYRLFGIPDQLKEKLAQVMLNPNTPESQAILAKVPQSLRPTIEAQLGPIFGRVSQATTLGIKQEAALQP